MAEPVYFTADEIVSCLPGGWEIDDRRDHGDWNDDEDAWVTRIRDTADTDWEVRVSGSAVAEHGRLDALRQAVETTVRASFKPGWLG